MFFYKNCSFLSKKKDGGMAKAEKLKSRTFPPIGIYHLPTPSDLNRNDL